MLGTGLAGAELISAKLQYQHQSPQKIFFKKKKTPPFGFREKWQEERIVLKTFIELYRNFSLSLPENKQSNENKSQIYQQNKLPKSNL